MKNWVLGLVLAASACAHADALLRADGARVDIEPPLRQDAPAEAQAFFVAQRVPPGEDKLDHALYERAMAQAAALPWYSLGEDKFVPGGRAPGQPDAATSTWTFQGPGNIGGRTRVLRFRPGTPSTMYAAGIVGGLWRSTDAGANWAPISDLAPNLGVTSLAIDASNADRMFIGTGEGFFNIDSARGAGIFVSADGGFTFTQLQSTNNANFQFVTDLVMSPNNNQVLYATTRTGLWRTLDGGATWAQQINGSAVNGCMDIAIRTDVGPNDTAIVSCGTFAPAGANTGVWQSSAANTAAPAWSRRLGPGAPTARAQFGRASLAVAPSNQAIMYALIACSNTGANTCGTGNVFNDGLLAVYRSADAGVTWTAQYTNTFSTANNVNNNLLLSNPIIGRCALCTLACGVGATNQFFNQGWYDNVIAVDPADPARIWVGGIDLWRSDDSGANWGVASYWWFGPSTRLSHADQHGLFFHPGYDGVTNRILYASNDGGLWRTDNARAVVGVGSTNVQSSNSVCGCGDPNGSGTTGACAGATNVSQIAWVNLNNSYGVTQFYHGVVYPNGTTYFGGTQDNGTNRGTDAGGANAWVEINGGDGGYVAVDPGNTNILYAETTGISISKSTNGGASFATATTGIGTGCTGEAGLFITPFLMDPNNAQNLWTGGRCTWRTTNAAVGWTRASSANFAAPSTERFSAFAVAPGNSNHVLFGTTNGQICRLTNATTSTNATALANCTQPSGAGRTISWLAFAPNGPTGDNTRIAFATVSNFGGNHLYRSSDGGQTWASIDGTAATAGRFPDIPAHSIVADGVYPAGERLYVGSDLGVFVSIDSGANWARENAGFANTVVEALQLSNRTIGTGAPEEAGGGVRAPATGRLYAFTHGRGVFRTDLRAAAGFCSAAAFAVPDNSAGGVDNTITLSGIVPNPSTVIDFDVRIAATHTRVGDLRATLTHVGSGTVVTLFDRPGVPAAGSCTGSGDNINANFDDDADFLAEDRCVDAATPTLSGAFKPAQALSAFHGLAYPGQWRLNVSDLAAGETGSVTQWCITATANQDAAVPVTLAWVSSVRSGADEVDVQWQTAASASTVAFEISATPEGETDSTRVAAGPDGMRARAYRTRAKLSAAQFWLRVHNADGRVDVKGPFAVGATRGAKADDDARAIDWASIRTQAQAAASAQARLALGGATRVDLAVRRDGVQRLTHANLMSAGASGLDGAPIAALALSERGVPVPMHVISSNAVFDAGDAIEFVGRALHRPGPLSDDYESLYDDANRYRLELNAAQALRMAARNSLDTTVPIIVRASANADVEENHVYGFAATTRDPWSWSRTVAVGSAAQSAHNVPLPGADSSEGAQVSVTLWGGLDFEPTPDDHHAILQWNGQPVADVRFDGIRTHSVNLTLPVGAVQPSNTLTLVLPGDTGHSADAIYLEDVSVAYTRNLSADQGRLSFASPEGAAVAGAPGDPEVLMADQFEADADPCSAPDACRTFAIANIGADARVVQQFGGAPRVVRNATHNAGVLRFTVPVQAGDVFWVTDESAMYVPEVRAVADTSTLLQGPADYLVIAHPQFANDLGALTALRQGQGLSTKVVTTEQIYAQYSHGIVDPRAIAQYIAQARAQWNTRYVLLVGGDSYDAFDDLGLGVVNFLPTPYRESGALVRFTPSDGALADTDDDGTADLAIGRLPVRSNAELSAVLGKILAYDAGNGRHAVMVADRAQGGLDFAALSNAHVGLLGNTHTSSTAYVDALGAAGARDELVARINAGARYVQYFGHSSPDRWSFEPVLTSAQIQSGLFTNTDPVLVNQLGCWTTYFVDPYANSMGHAWLLGPHGAAGVIGASALTDAFNDDALAQRLLPLLTQPATRVGEAVRAAKAQLRVDQVDAQDVQVSTNLLGDPAMRY
jgi:subtilisin-like proprotein convertase family protein